MVLKDFITENLGKLDEMNDNDEDFAALFPLYGVEFPLDKYDIEGFVQGLGEEKSEALLEKILIIWNGGKLEDSEDEDDNQAGTTAVTD